MCHNSYKISDKNSKLLKHTAGLLRNSSGGECGSTKNTGGRRSRVACRLKVDLNSVLGIEQRASACRSCSGEVLAGEHREVSKQSAKQSIRKTSGSSDLTRTERATAISWLEAQFWTVPVTDRPTDCQSTPVRVAGTWCGRMYAKGIQNATLKWRNKWVTDPHATALHQQPKFTGHPGFSNAWGTAVCQPLSAINSCDNMSCQTR
jgi:hypothetical protein